MGTLIDLTGKKFGRYSVIRKDVKNKFNRWMWWCKCNCGTEKAVDGQHLRTGEASSCGCFNADQKRQICIDRNTTHGMRKTRIYSIWMDMRTRCNNPKYAKYHRYGGNGIKICERWSDFELFVQDMGEPPNNKYSLDRIDYNADYTPENCRWATQKTQQNNRSTNRIIEYKGMQKTLQEWSRITGIPRKTISNRLDRFGWNVMSALNNYEPTPPLPGKHS